MEIIEAERIGNYIAKNRLKNCWYLVILNNEIVFKIYNLWIQKVSPNNLEFYSENEFKKVSDFINYFNDKNFNSHFVSVEIRKF